MSSRALKQLLSEVRACRTCEAQLPLGPRPVLRASNTARILIIGQAPGTRVHQTGIPWDDPSGERLRDWMQTDRKLFYDEQHIAIIPMGFCYPGKGKSGDLPPRPECAPQWHERLLAEMPALRLTVLIGQYAQKYYLETGRRSLTETVQDWQACLPEHFPLPHPSPRNIRWFRNNPWFESGVLPAFREHIRRALQ
ncbi:uracil-DNA glycosylase family protein [Gammaproteobacteria bacterium]|nr:uracil-DNA glycosylase family protein [Gammaproteobacteria bacterium]